MDHACKGLQEAINELAQNFNCLCGGMLIIETGKQKKMKTSSVTSFVLRCSACKKSKEVFSQRFMEDLNLYEGDVRFACSAFFTGNQQVRTMR
jgi:transcription elongation factor Elf1